MSNHDYITETENYIEERKNEMPQNVYGFIKQVCQDERKYIDMLNQMSQQKRVLKVKQPY